MRFPDKSLYKVYSMIFAWFCLGDLASMILHDSETLLFYKTLTAFDQAGAMTYAFALFRAVINVICLIPLIHYAFNATSNLSRIFQLLLGLRVITEVMGHCYDWLFLRSLWHAAPLEAWILILFYTAFFFPSYRAHFIQAFIRPRTPGSSQGTFPGLHLR